MVTWVLTVAGEDQPGMFEQFSEMLALMEGIILDSQQSILEGHCTAIYKVCLPRKHVPFAHRQFNTFAELGLKVISWTEIAEASFAGQYLTLEIRGCYRFGLEHDIRIILESHGVKVLRFNHSFQKQSLWGSGQMRLKAEAEVSRPLSESDLKTVLRGLANGLQISIGISDTRNKLAS